MTEIDNIGILHVGGTLINFVVSLILYLLYKTKLYRQLFIVWVSTLFSVIIQGILTDTHMHIVSAMVSNFFHSVALAYLLGSICTIRIPIKLLSVLMALSYVPAVYFFKNSYPFHFIAFLTAIATAAPLYHISIKAMVNHWKTSTMSLKCLYVSYLTFAIHYLDYPFLRVHPTLGDEGFTVGLLIIFAISMFALTSVIESSIKKESDENTTVLQNKIESQERFVSEYEMAKEIQNQYLPKVIPELDNFYMGHLYIPSKKVSGDYYDVFSLSKDETLLSVTDVTGKGLPASLITIELHHILKSVFQSKEKEVHKIMVMLNEAVYRIRARRKGCASFLAKLNHKTATLTYSDAGIGSAYLIRGEHLQELRKGGCLFGMMEKSDYEEETIQLQHGDIVLIASDGIIDAKNNFGKKLSEKGFEEFIKKQADNKRVYLMESIKSELKDYFSNTALNDDITVFTLEYKKEKVS